MSAFVVTETGVVVEYPAAHRIVWEETATAWAVLYEGQDAKGNNSGFIARVPKGCIPSFQRPTTLQHAHNAKDAAIANCLEIVAACIDQIPVTWANVDRLKILKTKLQRFDMRTKEWRPVNGRT